MNDAALEAVRRHPRLADLARSPAEQQRLEAFASDLARWLHGARRDELGALARVITLVARKELHDARRLSEGRPLLAVESAARAAQALWPLLRGPLESDEEPPSPEPPNAPGDDGGGDDEADGEGDDGPPLPGMGGGSGADGESDGEGNEEGVPGSGGGAGEGEAPLSPMEVLARLADLDHVADPELDALAEQLVEVEEDDLAAAAGDLLSEAGDAAAEGAIEVERAASHLERFLPGIGWSGAPGALETTLLEQLDGLTKLLANLKDLEDLADALGRLEDPTNERGTVDGGREEVVGVTMGGDVTNALPSELALLADDDTEDLFYQRFIEHRLISLELSGMADQGQAAGDAKGPVIACIDTSGSMHGAPELAAKALVLAVCRRVLPRNRVVHLLLFGGEGEQTEIRLKRGRSGLEPLLAFLLGSFHSGTDFDGPLLRAIELLEENELRRADILVVTDGLGRAGKTIVDRVNLCRAERDVRVWSVVLGRADPRGVQPFSDDVMVLDPQAAASATGLLRRI